MSLPTTAEVGYSPIVHHLVILGDTGKVEIKQALALKGATAWVAPSTPTQRAAFLRVLPRCVRQMAQQQKIEMLKCMCMTAEIAVITLRHQTYEWKHAEAFRSLRGVAGLQLLKQPELAAEWVNDYKQKASQLRGSDGKHLPDGLEQSLANFLSVIMYRPTDVVAELLSRDPVSKAVDSAS